MLFYVQMRWNYQGRISQEEMWRLEAEETRHAQEGIDAGIVKGIYKVASQHRVIAIVDVDSRRAEQLASAVGADSWGTDLETAISEQSLDAVIVSTPEGAHHAPVITALDRGARVLVEKPLALDRNEARNMVATGGDLKVAYSMRYAQRFAVAKQQITEGKIGGIVGGLARVYDTLAVGRAILDRSPTAGPEPHHRRPDLPARVQPP